ncbi:nucleoporin GLE1-like isoform X3 [Zingiber officinale]|uniref:nucleoporin GLE1-like isoform X3 n=1 Tax=Zingiber officinale TaxID=94328 RepID=UPI001C4CA08B|nr:nucleoporin GLE1-like isoform X3 [Zingiber officinale]
MSFSNPQSKHYLLLSFHSLIPKPINQTPPNTPDVQMQGSATVSVDGFCCMGKAERSPSGNSPSASTIRDEMDFQYEEGPNPGKPIRAMDSKHPMAGCSYNHSEKEYGHSAESQHDNPGLQEINPGAKGMSFVQQIHSFNDPIHDEPVIKHSADLFGYETEAIHGKSTSKNDTETGTLCQNLSLHGGMQDLSLSLDNLTGDLEKHNEIVMKPIVPKDQSAPISEREKYKEPDEFKRVAEEEWAQRNREIQSQAEEAQRLRKRKKAENLCLLDMEKRQKQRVEEIRESQRKTIPLKELIRAEVRKELDKMEWRYRDMASLLRGTRHLPCHTR